MRIKTSSRRNFPHFFPLVWLVYLGFPLLKLLERPRAPGVYAGAALLLVGFLFVYVKTFMACLQPGHERWAWLGWAYCLLAFAASLPVLGGTATTFLIYGGSLVGYQRRPRLALGLPLVNVLVMGAALWSGRFGASDLGWLLTSALFTYVAAYANHAALRRRLADSRLRQVQAEKEKLAQTAERERIARDLHDLLGHTLSVIVLKSELAARLLERDPVGAAREIREVERISREALGEVRSAVRGYRGSGLSAELGRSKVALDAAGIALDYEGEPLDLPRPVEYAMEMVLREAVTNVVRHSGARRCRVRITRMAPHFILDVHDDGVGGEGAEGTGLTSMRERVRAVGGELTRGGEAGTRLRARFPIQGAATFAPAGDARTTAEPR